MSKPHSEARMMQTMGGEWLWAVPRESGLSHRVSSDCGPECQPCEDAKALARELADRLAEIGRWRASTAAARNVLGDLALPLHVRIDTAYEMLGRHNI